MTKQTFRVTDMHCPNCARAIEGLEDDLAGVRSVRASYQKQQVEVEYDETCLTPNQIIAAIGELGYTVAV
jgi:copper chaperone CopZ